VEDYGGRDSVGEAMSGMSGVVMGQVRGWEDDREWDCSFPVLLVVLRPCLF
jgi:hypothetical protein